MKVIKYTNTMKKGESYTLNVVRVDQLLPKLKEASVLHSKCKLDKIIEDLEKEVIIDED